MAYLSDLLKQKKAEQQSGAKKGVPEILLEPEAPAPRARAKAEAAVPAPVPSPRPIMPLLSEKPAPRQSPAEKIEAAREKGGDKILLESYGDVRIYRVPNDPLYLYEVPTPRYRGEERALINALIDIAAGVISIQRREEMTPEELRERYREKVLEIIAATPELKVPINARDFYADVVVREMLGFGIIDPLVHDDNLEEIMVIGPNKPAFVFHRKYDMMKTNVEFYDDRDIRTLIDRIARNIGRRIDAQVPLLDARLPDGTRVNATVPPASLDGATITLRKFRKDPMTVIDLVNAGTVNLEVAGFLWLAADGLGAKPANILIAGGTASGKTTTLNVLASFVPTAERVITIEDTAELSLPLYHWIRFETRPPGIEGTGELSMDTLVKNTLRMRPDRIIVGEIRGEEGFTMFTAMNTGHDGSFGTVHANSAEETLTRLVSPPINVPEVMLQALNFVIVQHRIHDRRKGVVRRITEIAEVVGTGGRNYQMQVLFKWDAAKDQLMPTGVPANYYQTLCSYTGLSMKAVLEEQKKRSDVLADLQKKGARSMEEICSVTQNYILSSQGKV